MALCFYLLETNFPSNHFSISSGGGGVEGRGGGSEEREISFICRYKGIAEAIYNSTKEKKHCIIIFY